METRDGELTVPAAQVRDRQAVQRGFWGKVRRTLGQIPFSEDAIAAFYCAADPATPLRVKATLYGALAYFVLPVDAIPDFVAALGYADDAAVLVAAIRTVGAAIGESHRSAARRWLQMETPPPETSPPGDDARALN